MFVPLKAVSDLIRKILGKGVNPCTHCRVMNPDEREWKPCCLVEKVCVYERYRCCVCGREETHGF